MRKKIPVFIGVLFFTFLIVGLSAFFDKTPEEVGEDDGISKEDKPGIFKVSVSEEEGKGTSSTPLTGRVVPLPVGFPDSIPVYPDSTLDRKENPTKNVVKLTFYTDKPWVTVYKYTKNGLSGGGWEIINLKEERRAYFINAKRDGLKANFAIYDMRGETSINISYGTGLEFEGNIGQAY